MLFVVVQTEELLPLGLQEERIEMLIDHCAVLNSPTLGIPPEQRKENSYDNAILCGTREGAGSEGMANPKG